MSPAAVYEIEHLWRPGGWHAPGFLEVDSQGRIASAGAHRPGASVPTRRIAGFGVPGVANLHSHAFQRALAGRAERSGEDTFWTWRARMYEFVARLEPGHCRAIAAMAYMEMLEHGFTAVGEFHYLHHDPLGRPYANQAEMSEQCIAAATDAGIALTLLPTFYAHGGFGAAPEDAQRRFVYADPERFLSLVATLCAMQAEHVDLHVGVALHSLRAVSPPELAAIEAAVRDLDAAMPIHIHVAEQPAEVEASVAALGARPVAWLLANAEVDARWTLVHGTHADAAERRAMAGSGAVVCLCPATEAALGDGLFPLDAYEREGGRWGIGTDAHYTASIAEELRILEFGQRLAHGRRAAKAAADSGVASHTGRRLYDSALGAGASSLAQPMGGFEPGTRADLVVLDAGGPVLIGHGPSTVFDAWVLSGTTNPVAGVMVGGRWRVEGGRHSRKEEIMAAYARALAELFVEN